MGELFNTQHAYVPLINERLIDFIRLHISQIGGLSPARKVAALSEFFGVRTAWHGPGDASPLAHAAQLALELVSYNFGVHEGSGFPKETQEVFVGCHVLQRGSDYEVFAGYPASSSKVYAPGIPWQQIAFHVGGSLHVYRYGIDVEKLSVIENGAITRVR
jgi:hypothetical protein